MNILRQSPKYATIEGTSSKFFHVLGVKSWRWVIRAKVSKQSVSQGCAGYRWWQRWTNPGSYLRYFSRFKKGVLEWISTCAVLYRAVCFYSNPYTKVQVAATITTLTIWTRKISGSTARYIYHIALTVSCR